MSRRRWLVVVVTLVLGAVLAHWRPWETPLQLVQAGLGVTFVEFDGGHEIPGEVVAALGKFLAAIKR